jgi:hypothetical protein
VQNLTEAIDTISPNRCFYDDSVDSERIGPRKQTGWTREMTTRTTSEDLCLRLQPPGRHGKGAALVAAREHGAIYGQGEGLQGRSYAIPTKRKPYERMELFEVKVGIDTFLSFAQYHPEYEFIMTEIGCGLAGCHF